MAMKNMADALGDLEKTKVKAKSKKKTGRNVYIKTDKNINLRRDTRKRKKCFMCVTLEPAVHKKLWLHKVNAGISISATINQLVKKHLK